MNAPAVLTNPSTGHAGAIPPGSAPNPVAKPIIYACSGCSDAGELADRIARELSRSGVGKMSCLAGIGGRVKSIMAQGEKAQRILVIDGCPLNCARKTLELAGFKGFGHVGLHEIGLRKGNCPPTHDRVAVGVEAAKAVVARIGQPNDAERPVLPAAPQPAIPAASLEQG